MDVKQDMEVFVPRFPLDLPASSNPHILNITLARIDPRDLTRVMVHWSKLDDMTDEKAIKRHFKISSQQVCHFPVEKNAFEKYLLRPHITVHSGAKPGNKYSEKIARQNAREIGKLVKQHGFSFWYGGGGQGLMGESGSGFADPGQKTYDDQYSLQVSPAQFVLGVKDTAKGLRAVNEGLAQNTDAAIVTPNFIVRRHILDTALTKQDAAVTVIGAEGSLDEWADIATHIKAGLMKDRILVGVNPRLPLVVAMETPFGAIEVRIPFLHTHFWNPLQKQRKNFVKYGYGTKEAYEAFPFLETPEAAFSHIMKKLDASGNNPHEVYERRLKEYLARKSDAATPVAEVLPAAPTVPNNVVQLITPKRATNG